MARPAKARRKKAETKSTSGAGAKSRPLKDREVAEAALDVLSKAGWAGLTREALAKTARRPVAEIGPRETDPKNILRKINHLIDEEMQASPQPERSGSPHDRLFEVMMGRIDTLQARRPSFLALLAAIPRKPALIPLFLPNLKRSMEKTLLKADLASESPDRHVKILGLMAVYALTLVVWQRDESRDLAPTMAKLDRNLRIASRLAETFLKGTVQPIEYAYTHRKKQRDK